MAEFVKDLFLHFFIMMMIPLVHNFLSQQKKEHKYSISFYGIIVFTIFLTMLFPVKIGDDVEFDLKFIPVFIAFIYGGSRIGLLSILSLVMIDYFLRDTNILMLILNYGIIFVLFYFILRKHKVDSPPWKLGLAFLFYLAISVTRFIVLFNMDRNELYIYLLLFSIVSYITLTFVIYLIEMNDMQLFMKESLQKAEKLNSISQLAASVAHEIRNPMTTIRGFMQILKDEKNLTDHQHMYVAVSLEELDRAQTIVSDFLSLARPNSNEYRLMNISPLLKELTEFMRPYAMISNTGIISDIQDDLIIKGSPHEFKQVMINFLKNGIEAMPMGGNLEISAIEKDSKINIAIKDEGIGLSKTQIKKLGQPYYSTKTKGTGLGLMISFDIIKRMNGKVDITSEVNIGTRIQLTFPKSLSPSST